MTEGNTPRNRRPRGRPTKLDPAVHAKVVELLRAGNYLETAAAVVGVDPRNIRHWMRKGARGIEPYCQFAHDVDLAMGEAETAAVALLRAHGRKDWRALAWWLERSRPARFGQTLAVSARVDDQLDEVVETLRSKLDPETFQRVADALDESGREDPPGSEASRDPLH